MRSGQTAASTIRLQGTCKHAASEVGEEQGSRRLAHESRFGDGEVLSPNAVEANSFRSSRVRTLGPASRQFRSVSSGSRWSRWTHLLEGGCSGLVAGLAIQTAWIIAALLLALTLVAKPDPIA